MQRSSDRAGLVSGPAVALDALEAARNDSAKETNKEPEGTIELHNDE